MHLKTEQYDSSFLYIDRAIQNSDKNDISMLVRPYAFISEAYLKTNQLDRAIYYAEMSIRMEENKVNLQFDDISLIQATMVLSKTFERKGNFKKAYAYIEKYYKYSNAYIEGNTSQKVADMQSMFEFEKELNIQKLNQQKDKEIAQLEIAKERIMRNAFLVGSALLFLLLILLFSQFNLKKKINAALREWNETIQKEKQRSDDLLLNILPEEIAEELKQYGEATAQHFGQVSILFTDFKEFTQLSERLGAIELVAEINHYFKAFDTICDKYDIEKIKTIGDAYMAAGGLPVPSDNSAKNTVLAALEMQAFVINRKSELDKKHLPYFEMRVGIYIEVL
jgi:hypothetical protein